MYSKRLKYYREVKEWNKETTLSGTLVAMSHGLSVGTPCLASINKGTSHRRPVNRATKKIADKYGLLDPFDPAYESTKKSEYSKLLELIKNGSDISTIQKLLCSKYELIEVIIPFVELGCGMGDMTSVVIPPQQISCNSQIPIIYDDNFYTAEIALDDFPRPSFVIYQLTTHRFVNYEIRIGQSNVKKVQTKFNKMVAAFKKFFPFNICTYYRSNTSSEVLLDTLSISFYKLSDVIPVFDYRSCKEGMCMEVTLANSSINKIYSVNPKTTAKFRFLFSATKENILSIDGEKITRGKSEKPVDAGIKYIYNCMNANIPNDNINIKTIGC